MTEDSTFNERSLTCVVGQPEGHCTHTGRIEETELGWFFHPTLLTRQECPDGTGFTSESPELSPEQASLDICTTQWTSTPVSQQAQ